MKDFILPKEQKTETRSSLADKKKPGLKLSLLISNFFLIGGVVLIGIVCISIPKFLFSPPENLTIYGNDILTRETIINNLNIGQDESWSSLDPYILSLRLKEHPWIENVVVHRSIPLGIDVHITERVPIAYLKTKNDLFLLGKDYLVLKTLASTKVWDLPIIVDANLKDIKAGDTLSRTPLSKAFSLIELLKNNMVLPLNAVSEIIITDPFNYQLVTIPKGVRIKLGYRDFEKKLVRLGYAMPKIASWNNNVRYLDLRYSSGVVVKKKI